MGFGSEFREVIVILGTNERQSGILSFNKQIAIIENQKWEKTNEIISLGDSSWFGHRPANEK